MNSCLKILLYSAVVFLVSCSGDKPDMITVINADGSCYREFNRDVDSAFMVGDTSSQHNPFVVKIDSTWKISWEFGNSAFRTDFPISQSVYDSIVSNTPDTLNAGEKDKKTFTVHIRRNYKSVEDMASNFKLKKSHAWSDIKVKYTLNRKFRWFYTYYTYRETYPKFKIESSRTIEKYMTKAEARFWFSGEQHVIKGMNGVEINDYVRDLENKYNCWFTKSVWDIQFKALLTNYDLISPQPVSKERLALLNDSIFESIPNITEDCDMQKTLNKYFKTKVFSVLWKTEKSPMKKFEDDFANKDIFSEGFNYKLRMPGEIIQATNAVLKDGELNYRLTGYRMLYDNYTIQAQSQKANSWAFVLTGIILMVAIGSFFYKPGRKRNMG